MTAATHEELERTVAEDIGKVLGGEMDLGESESEVHDSLVPEVSEETTYEFDGEFQTKIAALVCRDSAFNERTTGLVKPDFFENVNEGVLVNLALEYFAKYRRTPDRVSFAALLKEAKEKRRIRPDMWDEVKNTFRAVLKTDIADADFAVDKVADFARYQAVSSAILESVEMLDKGRVDEIVKSIKTAAEIGATGLDEYDYFVENESRTNERLDILAGKIGTQGITTGIAKMDEILFHKGWGRGELSVYMGGAKAGKSTALINSCLSSVMVGYNALYITLEVSKEIAGARADANLADMTMDEVRANPHAVKTRIQDFADRKTVGKFKIHEFPSGTMRPSDLRRLIQHYKAQGIVFDLIALDYLDIMAPDFRTNDPIENSKSVWVDCRAIAMEEKFALLSATQTNRDGFKSAVAKAEHVAEDFNKIRTADLVISINKTEEEAKRGEARLYFAASRNQATGFSIHVKQDLAKMKFVTGVSRVE